MNPADRKRLKKNHVYLLENLEVDRVIEVLYGDERDILDDAQVQELKSKATPRERRKALLELLPRRGPQAFQAFCDALEHDSVKQRFVLDQILGRAATPEGTRVPSAPREEAERLEEGLSQLAIGSGGSGGAIASADVHLDDTDRPIRVRVEPCSQGFFNAKTSNSQPMCYTMVSKPRGLACVVSNTEFDPGTDLWPRRGGKVDCDNVTHLLAGLGFKVLKIIDKTASEIETLMQTFAKEEAHRAANCCVVVMMSHGEPEHVYGRDGKLVSIPKVIRMFDNQNCAALREKPKLFFFQACRGKNVDKGTAAPDLPDSAPLLSSAFFEDLHWKQPIGQDEPDVKTDQPTATDMLICYPTQLGNVSFRNADCGSWFIQALTKVFMRRAKESTILSMMTEVNRLVSEKTASSSHPAYNRGKQASECVSRLRKELYFFPGI